MTLPLLVALLALVALTWRPGRARPRGAWQLPRGRHSRPLRSHRPSVPDLAVVVTEVAGRLRAGSTPEAAWAATVDRLLGPATAGPSPPGATGVLSPLPGGPSPPGATGVLAPLPGGSVPPGATVGGRSGTGPPPGNDGVPPALGRLLATVPDGPAVRTVVAASRLTATLGAPLAEVLDRCAGTVTEAEQARDARRVALAGPRSTARILAGLPLLGLLLGAGLGADPVAAATDGGWGTVSVTLGLLLLAVGRRWTGALVAAAEAPAGARRRPPRAGVTRR